MMGAVSTLQATPLYERVLGNDWKRLDCRVKQAHLCSGELSGVGNAQVSVHDSAFARFTCRFLGVPEPGEHSVGVRVKRRMNIEIWTRLLGSKLLVTKQRFLRKNVISEQFGLVEFDLEVGLIDDGLSYRSTGAKMRLGPISLPLVGKLRPMVSARETATARGTKVDVTVYFPGKTRLFSYTVDLIWSPA
jgi:hypothetical protein